MIRWQYDVAIKAHTEAEIARAYGSKAEAGGFGPVRIPARRAKDLHGWALKFKQLSRSNGPIVATSRHLVTARKDQTCAAYQLDDQIGTHRRASRRANLPLELLATPRPW
jgi:hypothetical protein